MKLTRLRLGPKRRYGIVAGNGLIDASARFGAELPNLRSALGVAGRHRLRDLSTATPGPALADVTLLPMIPNADKIFGIDVDCLSHLQETSH